MINPVGFVSFDTNVLLPAILPDHEHHSVARTCLETLPAGQTVVCELVLMELYTLLRNPSVCTRPLSASDAVATIEQLRCNPAWRLVDYPGGLMQAVWATASQPHYARRRIFDARLALCLRHYGVSEFITRNVRDFEGFNFTKVWSPY